MKALFLKAADLVAGVAIALTITYAIAFVFHAVAEQHKQDNKAHPCTGTVVACTFNQDTGMKAAKTVTIKAKALYMLHGEKIVKALEIIQDIVC